MLDKILIFIVSGYYFYIVGIGVYIFLTRKKAVEKKEVSFSHFKSYTGETTEYLTVVQNHYSNQFQMPVLFMIVCLLSLQQHSVNALTIVLASLFFISRVVHSYIHLGSNNILNRAKSYFFGVFMIAFMFLQLVWQQILN